jgi:hypothetical protein
VPRSHLRGPSAPPLPDRQATPLLDILHTATSRECLELTSFFRALAGSPALGGRSDLTPAVFESGASACVLSVSACRVQSQTPVRPDAGRVPGCSLQLWCEAVASRRRTLPAGHPSVCGCESEWEKRKSGRGCSVRPDAALQSTHQSATQRGGGWAPQAGQTHPICVCIQQLAPEQGLE